ncbi:MAG: chromosome segregation protein SMC [Anaerolineales bacterium]|nr:chromosome segregation protein SMC [Anaerolineales bacterium]
MEKKIPRLKSLEIQGYKTFATKFNFGFAPTITAIVGPNGSGKSNITDAIRWVLGEQSFSLLRGKRTEDMIFAGSETRPRASMAAATITFDNSDGWLPIDFTEVTIGRRAYRDGQNEYMLNGQRVRLRDVNDLLSKCGLSQRTYTIIGQGLVDAALSLRADERRQLFEEAAGIGLYRNRREEALRRLDATKRNLERVQDILTELKPRLRSLKRQVDRSKDYDQVRTDLHEILRIWYGYHWYRLMETVSTQVADADRQVSLRDDRRVKQAKIETEMRAVRTRSNGLRSQMRGWRQRVTDHYQGRERSGRELAVGEERLRWLTEQDNLLGVEIQALQESLTLLGKQVVEAETDLAEERTIVVEFERRLGALLQDGEIDSAQRTILLEESRQVKGSLETLHARGITLDAQGTQLQERQDALLGREERLKEDLQALRKEKDEGEGKLQEEKRFLLEAEEMVTEALTAETAGRDRLETLQSGEDKLTQQINVEKVELGTLSAQLSASQSNKLDEAKLSRLHSARDEGRLSGYFGSITRQIQIPRDYDQAIYAALGDFFNSLTFADLDQILLALEGPELDATETILSLLPLKSGRPVQHLDPIEDTDCVGNAADLVTVADQFRPAVELLLGRTLVVRDRRSVKRLIDQLPADGRLVTLQGDIFYPTGQAVIGLGKGIGGLERDAKQLQDKHDSKRKVLESMLGQLEEIQAQKASSRRAIETAVEDHKRNELKRRQFRDQSEQASLDLKTTEHKVSLLEDELSTIEDEIESVRLELVETAEQAVRVREERQSVEAKHQTALLALDGFGEGSEVAGIESRLERARGSHDKSQVRVQALLDRRSLIERDLTGRRERLNANRVESERLQEQVRVSQEALNDIRAKLEELQEQMRPAEEALTAAENSRVELEAQESEVRLALQAAEREHSHMQIGLARKQEELTSLKRRIEDDFGLVAFEYEEDVLGQEPLPFEGIVERLPRVEELPPEIEKQSRNLRIQLRRMGPVNPEARREYREVNERVEFLTSQVDDLRKAEGQIHEVIAELDVLMEREFRKTFDAVAIAFREAFTRLFDGGSAHLTLTDPDDLTRTGIDIDARLPGRRTQGLAMLSGGERSLTASALIFALLKVSPTPFCVLDEVDAMLDEANVTRFTDMLAELSQDTQFILITHNRLTVQAAEVVYGVSMGADTTSKVIGLKLDELEKELAS